MTLSDFVIPPWVKTALKLAPYVVILVLGGLLFQARHTIETERSSAKLQVAQAALHVAETELRWGSLLSQKQTAYAQSLSSLQKVKDTSYADTTAYAKTTAGSSQCLTADRMSSIAEYARSAEAAIASGGGAGPVSGNGDTAK